MFYFLSKILDVLLSPFTWGLALLAFAVPWRGRSIRTSWRRKRVLGAMGLGLLWVASTEPVDNGLQRRLEHGTHDTFREDVTYDAVVLLGGVVDERVTAQSGKPSYNDNVERVVATHRLLQENRARFAIISGAPMDPAYAEHGEARELARQLAQWGIAPERVLLEERARNTRENAVYSKAIAEAHGFRRVVIVTSAFHMPRASECFAAVDMDVDTFAVDYRSHEGWGASGLLPRATALASTTSSVRELFGRLVYRFQGYGKSRAK